MIKARADKKILFLARSLDRGGAERQLVALAAGLRERGADVLVAVFYAGGPLELELRSADVQVRSLGKRGRWDIIGFFLRLLRLIRAERPRVLHSYLDVPNVVAALAAPLVPQTRIIWGIRSSHMDLEQYDRLARFGAAAERALAWLPDTIILNSRAGRLLRASRNYPVARMHVVPNGIDISRYRRDRIIGMKLRERWAGASELFLIGNIGRFDPMKDHPTFLRAAALVRKERNDVRFVCVGDGADTYRQELQQLASELGLDGRIVWAGVHMAMEEVYNALDVVCSSSSGEGFSNVVGEAMACGVPCVVTDVGDSAWIVDDPLSVVRSGDPTSLAAALLRQCNMSPEERTEQSFRARRRIETEFSLERLLDNTEAVLWPKG